MTRLSRMTPRERYLAVLRYESADRIPFQPGWPREKTLKRWHAEGLPEDVNWFEHLCKTIGIARPYGARSAPWPGPNVRMNPTFEEKVLEHRDGHYIVQDWMGNITEISDEYDYTYIRAAKDFVTRKWHKFPVETRADFEEMKKRYRPEDPERYPEDFEARVRILRERDEVCAINIPGPFWQMREWCGFEPLCILFLDDPDFVREMVAFWSDFVSATLDRVLEAGVLDAVHISEDMAYKEKSMISPAMAAEFLASAWSRWASEARQAGVSIVDMDSDGYIENLIPVWIESGINVCDPVEVAAGNDLPNISTRFGTRMAYRQGVDKRCIAKGGVAIEDELRRLEPVVRAGGYIPGCDHGVPHDISWPDFVRYSRMLAEMTGWL